MEDKPISKPIGELCNQLDKEGLPATAKLLNNAVGDRSVIEHDRWDNETRAKAQERIVDALAEGMHTPPKQGTEVPPQDLRSIDSLPPIVLGKFSDAEDNTELRALEAAKVITRDGKSVLASNPGRLLSGLLTLLCDETIWRAYGAQLKVADLFDDVVSPVRDRLRPILNRNNLFRLSSHALWFYGVKVHSVDVARIYQGAPDFVALAGTRTALTLSTSSGVIDPLERFGTDEVLEKLRIDRESEIVKRIARKSPWRVVNFRDGLLNPDIEARRLYFYDRQTTGAALANTLAALPEDKQEAYKRLAADLLAEALQCPRFELYEVQSFEPWMWRYTRSAPGHVLISLRHPETRSITEGIELNFKDIDSRRRWFQRVFRWAGVVPGLAIPVAVAGEAEDLLFEHVDKRLIRREAEEDILRVSKRVHLEGDGPKNKRKSAYEMIEQLSSAGTI
jgi:hypothetical protein